ncbi:MAG: enoyl-CoA hydratase/isomerase family protein [Alphaproteobacteria bacterium]|nr:enoyl-CoA hydratase/isomerase family protein [Alphaproteobacteria bacterium]
MSYRDILYETDGPVLTITLNRPDKLNAYTAVMGAELEDAFTRADADDAIRAIIVTGAGRGFCAGADISAGANAFDAQSGNSASFGDQAARERRSGGAGFIGAIYNCRKPSIAAFNGPAVGVGLTLTLPMDIKIAASTARFGFVFARRGLVPEAASAWFLPQLVGLSQALKWCLTGRVFNADEALAGGLLSEVVPSENVLERARALAREIAEETSPIAIALTRQMLWRFAGAPDYSELLKIDGVLAMQLGAGADVKEGVMAFLEKRKPQFPGKVSKDMPARYPWWEA